MSANLHTCKTLMYPTPLVKAWLVWLHPSAIPPPPLIFLHVNVLLFNPFPCILHMYVITQIFISEYYNYYIIIIGIFRICLEGLARFQECQGDVLPHPLPHP